MTKQEYQKLAAENKLFKATPENIIKQQQQQQQQLQIQAEPLQRQNKKQIQKNARRNKNTEKGRNEDTKRVTVKKKMKILSKTIEVIMWIVMVVMNGNILVKRRKR